MLLQVGVQVGGGDAIDFPSAAAFDNQSAQPTLVNLAEDEACRDAQAARAVACRQARIRPALAVEVRPLTMSATAIRHTSTTVAGRGAGGQILPRNARPKTRSP
jgi:hypothetical protein